MDQNQMVGHKFVQLVVQGIRMDKVGRNFHQPPKLVLSNHLLAIVSYRLLVERSSLRNEPEVVVVHINNTSLPKVWTSINLQIFKLNLSLFNTTLHVL